MCVQGLVDDLRTLQLLDVLRTVQLLDVLRTLQLLDGDAWWCCGHVSANHSSVSNTRLPMQASGALSVGTPVGEWLQRMPVHTVALPTVDGREHALLSNLCCSEQRTQ